MSRRKGVAWDPTFDVGRSAPRTAAPMRPQVQRLLWLQRSAGNEAVSRLVQGQRAEGGGLPAGLEAGVESLSGISMENVSVHYDSSRPAQVDALAYAQGRDIHLAPGQEGHLPHEAWHVVQQAQGRVRPTMETKDGTQINDADALEREADLMGSRALEHSGPAPWDAGGLPSSTGPIQRISTMKAKAELQNDTKYWPLYVKWFGIKGATEAAELLGPLEDVEAVKKMLDAFFASEKTDYTDTEIKKMELIRNYGKSPVFAALVADIPVNGTPAAQLDQLLANFVKAGPTYFEYTMDATDPTKFLGGMKEGDCNTLVRSFKLIAENYLGIKADHKTSGDVGFSDRFAAPRLVTIDGKSGNVDAGASWHFENHYWIEALGQKYDVLFGKKGVDTSSWVKLTNRIDNLYVFGDLKIWGTGQERPISGRYTTKNPKL
jgi:hypothetical protein